MSSPGCPTDTSNKRVLNPGCHSFPPPTLAPSPPEFPMSVNESINQARKLDLSLEFSHLRMLSAESNRKPNSKYTKSPGNVPFHIKARPTNAAPLGLVNVVGQIQCWGSKFLCLSTGPPSASWHSLLAQLLSFSQDAFPGSKSHKQRPVSGNGKAKFPLAILF